MKTVVLWGQKERTFWARWFLQRVWNVIPWLVILMLCPSGLYTVNEDPCGQALCTQGVGPKVPSVFGMLSYLEVGYHTRRVYNSLFTFHFSQAPKSWLIMSDLIWVFCGEVDCSCKVMKMVWSLNTMYGNRSRQLLACSIHMNVYWNLWTWSGITQYIYSGSCFTTH